MATKKPIIRLFLQYKAMTITHNFNIQMEFVRSVCMAILFLSILFVVLLPSSAIDLPVVSRGGSRSNAEVSFIYQTWMSKQGKIYTNGVGEKEQRFEIFKDNLHFIDQHNAKNLGYKLGLTRFADLTVHEYRDLFSLGPKPKQRALKMSPRYVPLAGDELPESVDWRNEGAVSAIKDQGNCSE